MRFSPKFITRSRGTLHRFKNVGAETAKMLIMAIPAGLEKFLREVGQPAQEGRDRAPLGAGRDRKDARGNAEVRDGNTAISR